MLMVALLAGASAFVSVPAAQENCAAQQNIVPVSVTPNLPGQSAPEGVVPHAAPKGREPAVLLPECKAEPRKKRKKRLSDYPMA